MEVSYFSLGKNLSERSLYLSRRESRSFVSCTTRAWSAFSLLGFSSDIVFIEDELSLFFNPILSVSSLLCTVIFFDEGDVAFHLKLLFSVPEVALQ